MKKEERRLASECEAGSTDRYRVWGEVSPE
jgi:hypothetical protein